MHDPRVALLLRSLDQAFDQSAWHGPNLWSALHTVTPGAALWQPQPERHNIWEIAVHAAYWKFRILRYVAADPSDVFDEPGSDWFERTEGTATRWAADKKRLRDWHTQLRSAIADFAPGRLGDAAYDGHAYASDSRTFEDLILGAAAHDVYHAGQIRLLLRMHEAAE